MSHQPAVPANENPGEHLTILLWLCPPLEFTSNPEWPRADPARPQIPGRFSREARNEEHHQTLALCGAWDLARRFGPAIVHGHLLSIGTDCSDCLPSRLCL